MRYENPDLPEGINNSEESPLKDLFILICGVLFVVALAIAALSYSAQYLATEIPFSVEKDLARKFDFSIVLTAGQSESKKEETTKYLQALTDRLAKAEGLPDGMNITVHYVDSEVVNAYAHLGGHIVMFRGLMEKFDSENALATVLAHEIAHVKLRHPIMALGRGVVVAMALSALSGVGDFGLAEGAIANTSAFTALAFSRSQERDADEEALRVINKVYGHVGGAVDLFKILLKTRREMLPVDVPEFFTTHPDTEGRVNEVSAMADREGWKKKGELTKLPELFNTEK